MACAPATKITNTWTAPQVRPAKLEKVLVIAETKKAGARNLYENAFVEEFEKCGIQAIPSAALLPADAEITRQLVVEAIEDVDIDAVFVMELLEVKEETFYVPPRFDTVAHGYAGNMMHAPVLMAEPGYLAAQVTVRVQSRLYETASGRPVWEAIAEIENPVSAEKMLPGYRKSVMKALKQNDFFPECSRK